MSRNFLLFTAIVLTTSCNKLEKSKVILKDVQNEYYSAYEENLDKSTLFEFIEKTETVIENDPHNLDAHNFKLHLLTRDRNLKEFTKTVEELIIENPTSPNFQLMRGISFELNNDIENAEKYYIKCVENYGKKLSKNQNDYRLNIEYFFTLRSLGDSLKAFNHLQKMKGIEFEDWQKNAIKSLAESNDFIEKNEIIKYWKGEIEFLELEK